MAAESFFSLASTYAYERKKQEPVNHPTGDLGCVVIELPEWGGGFSPSNQKFRAFSSWSLVFLYI